jgi:hypothetical protein
MLSFSPKTLASVVLSLVVFLREPGLAGVARAEPNERRIVVESVLGEGDEVRAQVEAALVASLEEANVPLPAGEPLVLVITESPDDMAALRVGFRHGTEEVYAWTCRCSGLELQEQLLRHTREALRRIRAQTNRAAPTKAVVVPKASPPQPPLDPRAEQRWKRGLGLFAAGTMTTAIGGIGILSGGTVMIARAAMGAGDPLTWTVVFVGAGAGAVAIGVPLLVVGNRRTRFGRPTALQLLPAGPGLALRGRF